MVKNRFGLWLGLAVATMVGVGVAAYLALRHERMRADLNQVERLLQRSHDLVERIDTELRGRTSAESDASRA